MTHSLPWISPLSAAHALTQNELYWVLLYSGQMREFTGRYSYLALYPKNFVSGDNFAPLTAALQPASREPGSLTSAWFGYIGYEMHDGPKAPSKPFVALPGIWFAQFKLVYQFDHQEQTVLRYADDGVIIPVWPDAENLPEPPAPAVSGIASSLTKSAYLDCITATKEAIARGDFYQANITRKFTGRFTQTTDSFALFRRLCAASPSAYSAYMRIGDAAVLSSSPERFITMDANGHMESRPIKGTIARLADATSDLKQREALANSEKDRAENLMIVDLMRNDLARACDPGSVTVERLFEVSSYATLHHMASTISGQKRADVSVLEAVEACLPPGSMTGAPKLRAIDWCATHEPEERGVYSGALGWFSGDGACDFSVVIRTILIQGERFEFQVGGGIVADSEPLAEWQETLTKARGIMQALGLDIAKLEII